MHECPHCKHNTITSFRKLCASALTPAQCPRCGGLSYLQLIQALRAITTWVVLTWIFIGAALYQRMAIYLIGTIPALFFAVDKCMLSAPLVAISLSE
ncbi:MAG: hypothetical protein LBF16_08405 [Pseudomonadales bacterium]|jgi:hypothetical protein|nr:hypothetical protein [Pseudomonadales bacterium]